MRTPENGLYARVIVDVPSRETNRPFDYAVPPEWRPWVRVGSRVRVPFGSRVQQGFVIGLSAVPETDASRVKAIEAVLDVQPPLTEELVDLASWISRKYVCHEVAALQAMLPGALKAKYEKWIAAAEAEGADADTLTAEERRVVEYVRSAGRTSVEEVMRVFAGQGAMIRGLLKRGWLQEFRTMRDRVRAKTALTVVPLAAADELRTEAARLPARSTAQKKVLEYLADDTEPQLMSELIRRTGASPASVRALADRGLIEIRKEEQLRDPYAGRRFTPSVPPVLTEEQARAFDPVRRKLEAGEYGAFLLHGVTGSGKTEIYLRAIETCLALGKEAIVLVPEISLTPQMVERFKGRFGSLVAVLHSRLSQGERLDEWRKISRGQAKVAVGARSAVFAPFTRLGLIVVDEEHESSYKQEESPKYHAKEVALWRANRHGAVVVLGSATPSLESYREAAEGRLSLLRLSERVGGRPLPSVQILDMRSELHQGNRSMFSRALQHAIEQRLARREQIVLLLNRRGFATFVMCRSCGYAAGCPHCDISLTYHRHSRTMRCHYCGHAEPEVTVCPQCASPHIRHFGAGTQKVEEALLNTFPGIRVIRMDVDTTSEKGAHEKWLNQFRERKADVLLGTQMVAKGLDFPDVTLVGVIAADTVLNLPDFRAAEKTFQLLTQVAGRAGRHHLPGEVIVQTYNPAHYSIEYAAAHDYEGFARTELQQRKERHYPPYCKLILVTLSHPEVPLLAQAGERLARELNRIMTEMAAGSGMAASEWKASARTSAAYREIAASRATDGFAPEGARVLWQVLGPVASPIPRIKDRYRFQCVVKYSEELDAAAAVRAAVDRMQDVVRQTKLQISVDVDPQVMM